MQNIIIQKPKQIQENEISNEDLKEIKTLTGEQGLQIPYIPLLKVNNKKEKKIAIVDGAETEVELPAKKGFIITRKLDDGTYKSEFFKENLEGVILKVRWQISSRMKVEPRYYTREFDYFNNEIIPVYNNDNKVIFEGEYNEIKENFKTGEKNSLGKDKWSGQLQAIVYLHIDEEVYRLQIGASGLKSLFDYRTKFGYNESHIGFITSFPLEYIKSGGIEFWEIKFKKEDRIDIKKEKELLLQLTKFFELAKAIKKPDLFQQGESKYEDQTIEEIDIKDIPF